jgi:lipopolysaccharide transport system ATP-binding protein
MKVKVYQDIKSLVLGYSIKDRLGQIMYGTNTWHTKQVIKEAKAGSIYDFTLTFFANLGPGSYSIQTALHDNVDHMALNYEWRDLALVFNVTNKDKTIFAGSTWIEPVIRIENKL